MSACLWTDIDAYLESAVSSDMGTSSSYSTLQVKKIVVAGGDDSDDWEPEKWELPAVVIRGVEAIHDSGPHGDGTVHVDIRYPYVLVAVTSATSVSQAKDDAQELGRRLREMMRSRYALGGLSSTDGETVQQILIQNERVYVMPRKSSHRGNWFGIAALEIEVQTEI